MRFRFDHKLMAVMRVREDSRALDGRVMIDGAFLGGERSGGKPGRGSVNKVPLVAARSIAPSATPDNTRRASIKACSFDPLVQRSYAECAEGYSLTAPVPIR